MSIADQTEMESSTSENVVGQAESTQSEAEAKLAEEYKRRTKELDDLAKEHEQIRSDLNVHKDSDKEEPWKQTYNPDLGKGLRNSRGHFTSMGKEQDEALLENERLNNILKKIAEMKAALEAIGRDLSAMRPTELPASSLYRTDEDGFELDSTEPDDTEATPPTPPIPPTPPTTTTTPVEPSVDPTIVIEPSDLTSPPPPVEPPVPPYDEPEATVLGPDGPMPTEFSPSYGPPGADTPGYVEPPEVPYYPSPEVPRDWRREALIFLNELAQRDQERAIQRYGGLRPFSAASGLLRMTSGFARWASRGRVNLRGVDRVAEGIERADERISNSAIGRTIGRVRAWFDKVGSRTILTDQEINEGDINENLGRIANFQRTPGWRKAVKIGAKLMGGFGVAAATIMTGGIGAPTALLWAGGMKEGFDSIGQTVEHLGWGRRRATLELASQGQETEQINVLKAQVMERPMTQAEYETLVASVTDSEAALSVQETENITGERKGQMIRSLTTSAATIGVGLFAGVPFGKVNYDHDNTQLAETFRKASNLPQGTPIMDEAHRGFWNILNGGQFGYEHNSTLAAVRDSLNGAQPSGAEFQRMQDIIKILHLKGAGEWALTPTSIYGQTAHILGNTLPLADYLKLAAVPAYLAAETLRHFAKRPERGNGIPSPDVPYYEESDPENTPAHWSESRTYQGYLRWMEHGPQARPRVRHESPDGTESWVDIDPDGTERPSDRNVDRERSIITDYLERHPSRYRTEIASFASHISPMSERCRVSVNIPAYHEGGNISNLLEKYNNQTDAEGNPLDPELYEINILVNRGSDKPEDDSLVKVAEYKAAHPEFRVNVVDKVFRPEQACVGLARKYITDITMQRSISRPHQDQPLYIETEDADLVNVDPLTVQNVISKFDGEPQLDAVRGVTDRNIRALNENDLVLLDRRVWDFEEMLMRDPDFNPETDPNWNFVWNRVITNGWNSAYTAEAYASIGGYSPTSSQGEDMDIGLRISMIRGREQNGIIIPNIDTIGQVTTRSDSSNRRFLAALVGQYAAYGDGNFVNEDIAQRIRESSDEDLMRMIDEYKTITDANKGRFETILTAVHGSSYRRNDIETINRIFGKAMGFLGFREGDWHVESDGKVKIDNIQNFADACESYRTLGPLKRREFVKARDLGVDPARFLNALQSRNININQFENELDDAGRQEIIDSL